MPIRRRSQGWRQTRALVLAFVVFIGGFGLPAFDAIAYHWHPRPASSTSALPRLQQCGTRQEHTVQCVITHHAPAPRLASAAAAGLPLVATSRFAAGTLRPAAPAPANHHSSSQPRAPPASIA